MVNDGAAANRYGLPGDALSDMMHSMEDLFLWAMFYLYAYSKVEEAENEQD